MKILLDTCTFMWAISEPSRLSALAVEAIADSNNEVFLSAVSCWEIGIQVGLKRLKFSDSLLIYIPRERTRHGILSLPLDEEAAISVEKLPPIHRDPFDRMLIAQAMNQSLILLTPDSEIAKYPVKVLW